MEDILLMLQQVALRLIQHQTQVLHLIKIMEDQEVLHHTLQKIMEVAAVVLAVSVVKEEMVLVTVVLE